MEFLFNLIFLLLLIRFYGDRERDFYFNRAYKKLVQFTDPPYRFFSRFFPENQMGGGPFALFRCLFNSSGFSLLFVST